MKAAKLILLASPIFVSSALLVANRAEAAIVQSARNQSDLMVLSNTSQESNPILDQLGCKCPTCTRTGQELLQGKLPSVR
ncbi:hypothetical protein F7734_41875 [Scytonema sp. UIC 10036]|uniref:hypothetical protein n=1 Tax=Scytonema sp. UIC 10036 TaxID=2304196 RepID=UPI0012DAC808|nr:hypothetical protein [Scytonema sp. UIC 10036]MUG98500.1 hypothetical protein [Scytonema sp. UIC 10036]